MAAGHDTPDGLDDHPQKAADKKHPKQLVIIEPPGKMPGLFFLTLDLFQVGRSEPPQIHFCFLPSCGRRPAAFTLI